MRHSIPVRQVDELLQIIKEFGIDLPKSRKELTHKENELLEVRDVPNGQTCISALKKQFKNITMISYQDVVCDFNKDCFSLYKSSIKSIWPILGSFVDKPTTSPFVVGVWAKIILYQQNCF